MAEYYIPLGMALFFVVATLYASIGHAGASGYLAVMAILSFPDDAIKPTSLLLNILVSLVASIQYIRAGRFDKRIFWSFILTATPMAFVGGAMTLKPPVFKLVAGAFLVVSGIMLLLREVMNRRAADDLRPMPLWVGLVLGAVIGMFSGLVGVGGGIFLSPIIIMAGWCSVRNASGVAALFILCNSVAGLAGKYSSLQQIDSDIGFWLGAVLVGGALGAYLGTRKFNTRAIVICLFLVLVSAGIKFILIDFAAK